MNLTRIQNFHPLPKKRMLRSDMKDCELVDYEYADPVLEQMSRSQPRDYAQKHASLPDLFEDEFQKIKYMMEMKRKMKCRRIISLD